MEDYFLFSVALKSAYANLYASFVHNHCTIYRIFCDQKKPSLSSYEGQENSLEEKIKPFRFLRRVSRLWFTEVSPCAECGGHLSYIRLISSSIAAHHWHLTEVFQQGLPDFQASYQTVCAIARMRKLSSGRCLLFSKWTLQWLWKRTSKKCPNSAGTVWQTDEVYLSGFRKGLPAKHHASFLFWNWIRLYEKLCCFFLFFVNSLPLIIPIKKGQIHKNQKNQQGPWSYVAVSSRPRQYIVSHGGVLQREDIHLGTLNWRIFLFLLLHFWHFSIRS